MQDTEEKRLPEDYVGFTNYVRCKHCNAGGPWRYPGETMMYITAMMISKLSSDDEQRLIFGETATFDRKTFRYPTEAEQHLRSLIELEPSRAFLWTRLGNLYCHSERSDLAPPAYQRALELDPKDIEAHSMWAHILEKKGHTRKAIPHYQAVLTYARDAKHVPLDKRRELVRDAFEALVLETERLRKQIPFQLPEYRNSQSQNSDEPNILYVREFDLSNEHDIESICDNFLGEPPKLFWRRVKSRLKSLGQPMQHVHAQAAAPDISRNDPCPCGSGKKYKRCCDR